MPPACRCDASTASIPPSTTSSPVGSRPATHHGWHGSEPGSRAASTAARRPVDAIFDTLAEWASTPGYRGCAFLNTAAEVAEIDDRHLQIIAAHKRGLVEYLAELMRDAGAREPESLAAALGVLVDGAIVQAAVFGSLDPIHAAKAAADALASS